jgi:para-aminobenzoate synthetase/4-amino-4-deoxychorismate lyase
MDRIKPQCEPIVENEALLKAGDEWLRFSDPYTILTAERWEDVVPRLREIERLVQENGWYAAGFVSYEAAGAFDPAFRAPRQPAKRLPYLWFGLYPPPCAVCLPAPARPKELRNWKPTTDQETYNAVVNRIKDQIAAGRTYQVNYTMRLRTEFSGSAWEYFLHLAQSQNNQAGYIDMGRHVICSASPELFFQLDGDEIICRPMKGTTRRGRTQAEDLERSRELRASAKDRAENVMIVDMIRNDLGRIARTGTINVAELFTTERYPTLWQMISTVTARTDASITEIFAALFPCASITGAPKVSTMQIIAELENAPREVYTGSVGYLAPGRKAKFNVAIRTVWVDRMNQAAEYGVGGGVVWDSTGAGEYDEALLKARVLTDQPSPFSLLETMLWTPREGFFLYDRHILRMLSSADYFDIPITKQELDDFLERICSGFNGPQRVRVFLNQAGRLEFESRAIQRKGSPSRLQVRLASQPVDSNDVALFHKTTRRAVYESARKGHEEFDDVLLYNESGELTEFTVGNLVAELGGELLTPPVSSGLLPGTFRAHLLETGQIAERTIRIEELKDCTQLFRINSIRKWQRVRVSAELGEAGG